MASKITRPGAKAVDETPTNGPDYLMGTEGSDNIYALAGDDTVQGLGGGDTLNGGLDYDTVSYWPVEDDLVINLDVEYPGSGTGSSDDWTDTLLGFENAEGGVGDDLITGTPFSNHLSGSHGDDTLVAGYAQGIHGEDTLVGGDGDDHLISGGLDGDVDRFVFADYHRDDIIYGFEDGFDLIEYAQGADSFDDLSIENRDDGWAVVTVPGNLGTIEIPGMAGQLDASDFIFT
jgi:Ca2+-binding RTX toxin-like protein